MSAAYLAFVYLLGAVYASVLLAFWWGLTRRRPHRPSAADESPFVSVIIPARDEERTIGVCLRSILDQDYDRFEVILVDDDSQDATPEVARRIDDPRLRVLESDPSRSMSLTGKQIALDVGIRRSQGEIILTTDADCRAPSTWIARMVRAFEPDVGVVAGSSACAGPADRRIGPLRALFFALQSAEVLALQSAFAGAIRLGVGWACTGNNLGYRKQVYVEIGGFAKLGFSVLEDSTLLQAVSGERRWRMVPVCDPDATVITEPAPDVPAFIRQRIRWASNSLNNQPSLILYMVAVYGFYLLLPTSVALAAFQLLPWPAIIGLAALKAAPEFLLLSRGFRLFQRRRYLWLFPILQFAQWAYVMICGIAGLFSRGQWKGRNL